ncbi:hypothetical protein DSM112329_04281 [Paraconexibacter sp. AEG42_29]|uniref:Phenylacetate-CoA oxygenase subunit PaaI n=2 Tax=Paraconexibacter sp. AEG42_29 TaxID=2997339 RepID=A0AAU7B0J0_9ACTN
MVSLVGSLADNKAALGQRYGEWAVSAPALEAAVAAAAMAQDELGHARSTYPVLKALGEDTDDDDRGHCLALLDEELADWSAVIAANVVVDAVLSTFVASCVGSSVAPMAQRAQKILQEESSHRVHAEAWLKRLCRTDSSEREGFLRRLAEAWEHAGRWLGPDDDPGFAEAVEAGMISCGPAEQRRQVLDWLADRLAAEGAEVELDEPADWTRWDPQRRRWTA